MQRGMKKPETIVATEQGFIRYRVSHDRRGLPDGTHVEPMCTFIARIVESWPRRYRLRGECFDGMMYRVVGRSCKSGHESRIVDMEFTELMMSQPRRMNREFCIRGGLGFIIWPGYFAATQRAIVSCSEEEYSAAESALMARAGV